MSISILAAVAHNNLAALDERLSISTLFGLQGLAYYGSSMTGSRIGKTWQAINTHGQLVRSQEQVGKLHLYYFGFTQCPDICPSALANLSALYEELSPEEQAQLQLVFVSIDPDRDTPTVVQAYLDNFEGEMMGLIGSPEQIAQMAQQFRVKYRKVPSATSYTMEHSSQFFLFDKKAQPRLFYHSDADAHKIAQDIRHILGE
ncbi:MAG: SCO family protein [Pelistega sp.]|nr:SCO family protein [Pelistega sp.]